MIIVKKAFLVFLFCSLAGWSSALADEETRQVQEELRKRHLFFRDIDGRPSLEFAMALKRYQQRKGFAPTGVADEATLYSLGIGEAAPPAEGIHDLPDVPVLKSDAALHDPQPAPPLPPTKAQNAGDVAKAEIRTFLRRYFDACQSPNPDDELAFYADRVEYFDHGAVDKPYIRNELAVYDQRWPSRKYTIGDSLRVVRSENSTIAKIRIAFDVGNTEHDRRAHGRTDNIFNLAKRDNSLEIVSIKEARVRQTLRHRKRPPSFPAAVGRTIHHVLRNIFH
ncbi:MAG TPA: peptidoglycan-binding domain-containing protein [Chthoniobacterales bacterium]|nr:peptidoglycan-binding domain-containing protein [Chthoniobacterales bacterium]